MSIFRLDYVIRENGSGIDFHIFDTMRCRNCREEHTVRPQDIEFLPASGDEYRIQSRCPKDCGSLLFRYYTPRSWEITFQLFGNPARLQFNPHTLTLAKYLSSED